MTGQAGQLIKGVKNALPFIVKSSKGHLVTTQCGKTLLDVTCGIGVTNLGHGHPKVTVAAQKACETLVHAQQNIMRHEPMMQLIDKLASTKLAKSAGLDAWFFWNGGSDAVEAAIKIARQATGRQNIITANLGYHGRTFLTMGLTASGTTYRAGFGPLPSGIFPTPFPYVTRSPLAGINTSPTYNSDANAPAWGFESKENADMRRVLATYCPGAKCNSMGGVQRAAPHMQIATTDLCGAPSLSLPLPLALLWEMRSTTSESGS
jgi:4-aminobutyrate aminotransferase-like enzyme